jgi:hypothetical protein
MVDEQNQALARWRGASALVWQYRLGLRRIAVRLNMRNVEEVVFVVGIGSGFVSGPLSWEDASLAVAVTLRPATQQHRAEAVLTLRDERVGFELRCREIALVFGTVTTLSVLEGEDGGDF